MFVFSDLLKNLVGEANAKNGAIKLFEYFQDIKLNKHIFYVSFDSRARESSLL
jgi:sorting nexin-25